MPGSPGQLGFISSIVTHANDHGKQLGILFLQYDLMPQKRYPNQLRQAVEILRYTISHLGRNPAHVMLASDSAGGNLLLGVLSHISHPHPAIEPLHLSGSLKAAIMMSPWTNLHCVGQSYQNNWKHDPVSPATISTWATTYLEGAGEDNYNNPTKAPSSWWKNVQVQEILITAGGDEMMRADIEELAEKLKV